MSVKGLTIREWKNVEENSQRFIENYVTTLAPFGGFTPKVLGHLRRDWIEWKDKFIQVNVPSSSPCNSFKSFRSGWDSQQPLTRPRTEVCDYCRKSPGRDRFENTFRGHHEPSSYSVVLHRDIAEPAVSVLQRVFKTYGRPEVAFTPQAIGEAAKRVFRRVDVRVPDPNATTLLQTGPVIYSHYGLEINEIAELTPYSKGVCKRIIRNTPEVNMGNVTTMRVLRELSDIEPATVSEISDVLDITKRSVRTRLKRLKRRSRVTAENGGYGGPVATWKTKGEWKEPFRCSECDFESYSLGGIKTHENTH